MAETPFWLCPLGLGVREARLSQNRRSYVKFEILQLWNKYMQLHASFCKAIWLCRGPEPAMHNVYCVTTACSPSCVYCTFLGGMLFKARNWIYSTAVLTNVPNLDGIMIGPAFTWALNLIKSVNGLAGGLISYYRDIAGFIFANCYKFYKIPIHNISSQFCFLLVRLSQCQTQRSRFWEV